MNTRAEREALIDSIETGDLIRLNGRLRVVRKANHSKRHPGRLSSITMSIQRCSWTRQPFTVRARADLYRIDLAIVSKGFGCEHGPLEVMLQKQIENHHAPKLLECCDVIGVLA